MDKEVVVHIHNGILLSQKRNTFESVLMRWMNLEPIVQGEGSQKEKEILYSNTYIQNLEKMVMRNLFTGQHRRNRHR